VVEQGELAWGLTLGEAFPGIEMREVYRDVTLEDLLHHRGGIQPYTILDAADEERLTALTGTSTEIRNGFAAEVLGREPANPRGQYNYSNAGYALAALMAERATGRSWEDLITEYVFELAGVERGGIGWPATPDRPDQPRGHFLEGDSLRAQGLDEYPLGDYLDPAGDVHMSIRDLARYARMHLRGRKGEVPTLSGAAFEWLHTDSSTGDGSNRYAAGWMVEDDPEMGTVLWHNGSAGTFYAAVMLYPDGDRAVVVATNGGLQRGQVVADRVVEALAAQSQ
jgi:CubicO group peptidase (beta-lactamase class C family)